MKLKFIKRNRTLVVQMTGEIDHHTCEVLRSEVDHALERMGGKNIVFKMGGVSFMDSSGIGVIIGRYKNIQSLGGRIAVAEANERLEQIFQLSGLKGLIPSFCDTEEAVAYVEGGNQ